MKTTSLTLALLAGYLAMLVSPAAHAVDIVNGKLINFQSDGAWSWYQDERVILTNGQVLLGSVAAKNEGDLPGGGFTRDPGDIISSAYDVRTGQRSYFELNDSIPNNDGAGSDEVDDHNAPSFLTLPDGRILTSYTGHSEDNFLRFRKTANPGDTSSWTAETTFTRTDPDVSGENDTTYTNLHYIPNEGTGQGRVYNFFRNQLANSWDRHFVYSDDLGDSWNYGGQLTGENVTGRRPYTKFVDNGNGRIYYTTTEDEASNPNNIWVGYIEDGKTHRLDGTVVDSNLFDSTAQPVNQLSLVMAANSMLEGVSMQRLWNRDIALDDAGHPVVTFRGYANGDNTDSRHLYARWTGTDWTISQIAIGGGKFNSLDVNEQGGSGQASPTGSTVDSKLSVLDPNNPNIVYFSSQYDPVTQTLVTSAADNRPHFEMFKAVTVDGGTTWSYEQLTENSSVDNVRPTVSITDDGSTVVTWMRGAHDKWEYTPGSSWYAWDTAIVGLVEQQDQQQQRPLQYVDADLTNTALANGSSWQLETNYTLDGGTGDSEGLWHFRDSGSFGNGGTLFTANELSPYNEDNEVLRTSTVPDMPGVYDLWVMFWSPANHSAEWRVQATLDFDGDGEYEDETMIAFERYSSQGSELTDFLAIEKVEEGGNRQLYRGYVGRVAVAEGETLDVYIDDLANTDVVPIPGVSSTTTNWRTWYDGISYSLVQLAGDYNQDGIVNPADYTVWRNSLGSNLLAAADGNLDGIVDQADYEVWRANFGRTRGASSGVVTVPEPSTVCLAAMLAITLTSRRRARLLFASLVAVLVPLPPSYAIDDVGGTLITLTSFPTAPNGAWSWFEGERAIIDDSDPTNRRLLVSSVSAAETANGEDGDIDLLWLNVDTGQKGAVELHDQLERDDHNSAALLVRPDGKYLAVYAKHNTDRYTRWRISKDPGDPTSWGPIQTIDNGAGTTYSNLHYLPGDAIGAGRTYNFTRSDNFDPNILISTDHGTTWSRAGKLLTRGGSRDRPYLRYFSNAERIHFFTTEEHPAKFDNSVYHGYVQDGILRNSAGEVVDDNLFDLQAVDPTALTTVFKDGTAFGGTAMHTAWTTDVAINDDGLPVAVFTVRADDSVEDHRFFYARFDGADWNLHQVAKAGDYLYARESDYTGLAAIDPDDIDTLYISTEIDPRTGEPMPRYEIFRGQTTDGGASWNWVPITFNSTMDNIRPVVPQWNDDETALVWMRGSYETYKSWNTDIVALVDIRPLSGASIADLTGDGAVDDLDLLKFMAGLHTDLSGLSPAEARGRGDLNGDLVNDFADFQIFRRQYDLANGQGAFVATAMGVTDPNSAWLLSLFAAAARHVTR